MKDLKDMTTAEIEHHISAIRSIRWYSFQMEKKEEALDAAYAELERRKGGA